MNISDVKINTTIEYDGKLWNVVEYQKVNRPRLAALFRTKLKNIETGQVVEKNFLPFETVGEVYVETKEMQYSYEDGDIIYLMDNETYDLVPFNKDKVENILKYAKEDVVFMVKYANGKMVNIDLPTFVTFTVEKTEPAVKGGTTTNASKDAYTETGLLVKVPLFIEQGEKIVVTTIDGKYHSRA